MKKSFLGALVTGGVGLAFEIANKYLVADQEWWVAGENIDKEIALVGKRIDSGDHYPQGADFVVTLMRNARKNGQQVRILAQKTLPKYTWYVEIKEP